MESKISIKIRLRESKKVWVRKRNKYVYFLCKFRWFAFFILICSFNTGYARLCLVFCGETMDAYSWKLLVILWETEKLMKNFEKVGKREDSRWKVFKFMFTKINNLFRRSVFKTIENVPKYWLKSYKKICDLAKTGFANISVSFWYFKNGFRGRLSNLSRQNITYWKVQQIIK